MSKEKEQQQQRAAKLMPHKFTIDANSKRVVHWAEVPVGVTVQQMKDPEFWSMVAPSLRVHSEIVAVPQDGSYRAHLIVRSVGPNWARVEVLHEHQFLSAKMLVQKAKNFKVEWGSPAQKHCVRRVSDNEILKSGFDTPEQAAEWLAANQESMTAS